MDKKEVMQMRILCFGDSNTYGYDPQDCFGTPYPPDHRWPDCLAAQTGWEVINEGVNGRQIPRNPYALRLLREQKDLDLFLVMLGTNDLLQGASPEEAARLMESFLQPLLPLCRILLVAPPPMKRGAWVPTDALVEDSRRLAREYAILARKLGIPFADTGSWDIDLAFDGVHFTPGGHLRFAEEIKKCILPLDSPLA